MTQNSSPPQANQPQEPPLGLDFNQKWQLIQHFTDWIKHGDAKLQMLLTVAGVLVAAEGAFSAAMVSAKDTHLTCIFTLFVILFNIITVFIFIFGFWVLQPYTKGSTSNIFFYGRLWSDNLSEVIINIAPKNKIDEMLDEQIRILGGVALRKFNRVSQMQWIVFTNILVFILGLVSYFVSI